MAEVQQADSSPKPPAAAPLAARTTRLYAADWAGFARWCRARDLPALPASPATIAAYLAHGPVRLSPGTLARRLSAIAARHREAGPALPRPDPVIQDVLRQARRAGRPRRKPALPTAQLARMAAACPGDLAGRRDRALLLAAARTRRAAIRRPRREARAQDRRLPGDIPRLRDRALLMQTTGLGRAALVSLKPRPGALPATVVLQTATNGLPGSWLVYSSPTMAALCAYEHATPSAGPRLSTVVR